MKFLARYETQAYALLRIMSGFLLFWHGTSKLFGYPLVMNPPKYVLYIGGPIELIGGFLIMVGLFTHPAAFIASGFCAAAYWIGHGFNSFFPVVNKGGFAVLYAFVFLYIATRGAGIWSVDGARSRR